MKGATVGDDASVQKALKDPSRDVSKMAFEITGEAGISPLYKSDDDDFVIWGPASVPVVDRENDRIKAKALKDALPQLLKRASLSYEHTDQIVGEILKSFETEDSREVEIQGETYSRKEFPTDVLDYPGMDEPAMYVAGKVYGDTQKSREVREDIQKGDIRSYSISGEAIVSEMAVEDGKPVTDILKMDLSAVTLCRQGMNQKAKFGLVSKDLSDGSDESTRSPATVAKRAIDSHITTMDDNDNDELEKAFASVLDDRLPDGDLATTDDVEKAVDERFEELTEKGDGAVDEDDDPEDEDEVPEGPEGEEAVDVEKSFAQKLKNSLPDDHWEAIKPVVKDCMGGDDEPEPAPEEMDVVEPEDEVEDEEPADPMEELDAKSASELSPEEAEDAAESLLDKAGGQTPSPSPDATDPAHGGQTIESEQDILKAAENIEADPVMAGMMDGEGGYRI